MGDGLRGRLAAALMVVLGVAGLAACNDRESVHPAPVAHIVRAVKPCTKAHPCPTPTPTPTPSQSASPSPTATVTPSPSGSPSPSESPAPTDSATPTPSSSPTPSSTPAGQLCTSPYFTTSDPNGGITDGGFYVHNNLWNAGKYPGTTGSTSVCSYHSWNHTGTASNSSGSGEVKTYPNVHKDYPSTPISSLTSLTSRWAMQSPGVGIYDVAYDLWLNGVPGSPEVMVWTENHNQRPAGDVVARGLSFGGYTWDLWATSGNSYLAFAAPADATSAQPGWPSNEVRGSGSVDLLAMLKYLQSTGRVTATSTLGQVCYGVELVDTAGAPATWHLTDFSLT